MPSLVDFSTHVGTLELQGPVLSNASGGWRIWCWVAEQCNLEVTGVSLSQANRISMREDCDGPLDASLEVDLPNPAAPTDGDGSSYALGVPGHGRHKAYALCWHSVEAADGVPYGTLEVLGPVGAGLDVQCPLGSRRWNRNPQPQPEKFSKLVSLNTNG